MAKKKSKSKLSFYKSAVLDFMKLGKMAVREHWNNLFWNMIDWAWALHDFCYWN